MAEWVCKAQLGSGGFGIVHVWSNAKTGQNFALKKCKFGSDMALTARLVFISCYIFSHIKQLHKESVDHIGYLWPHKLDHFGNLWPQK